MPVRIRITVWFGILVFIILTLVCGLVYYFSYTDRINNIKMRLTNRAITTARLLGYSDVFNKQLVQKIDNLTIMSTKDKILQVYDNQGNIVYSYKEIPDDTIKVDPAILANVRTKNNIYFVSKKKDAIAHYYSHNNSQLIIISAAYDDEGWTKLRQLEYILIFSYLAGIAGAFVAGYLFSKRLLQPVRKIADDINEISAKDLTTRIQAGNIRDEWYYLSDTFNQLLDRLQESFEMQRRFISNASHELSTPLTSMSSQLEVFLQKDRNASQYRHVMQSVYQDVQHLSKLTQTLLEFAQAADDPGGLDIQPVRVDEVVLQLPSEIKKIQEDYHVVLSFDNLPAEEQQLIISGNAMLLLSAVKNIVANACKYSPDHTAQVTLTTNPGNIVITITDKGIGIPEDELKYIYQPFYRVQHAGTETGFGLGLSLSSRIIKLHKGRIFVHSQPGKGSVFTVILPVND